MTNYGLCASQHVNYILRRDADGGHIIFRFFFKQFSLILFTFYYDFTTITF